MTVLSGSADESVAGVVALAAGGDEAAFVRIVNAHHADMIRIAFVICGDADLADESVQSAWALVWRKLVTLRDPGRLRSWLLSVAANEARQALRRRRRRTIVEIVLGRDDADEVPDPAERAFDVDLANALARLSAEDRSLLALRYVAGLNATELGRATGRSASGTRARLSRLLERLRLELSDG